MPQIESLNCLDTSVIVDYLHGVDEVGVYVRAHESEPLFAPTISLQETFVGAVRTGGAEGLEQVRTDLDWIEPIDLTVDAAAEAAKSMMNYTVREPLSVLSTRSLQVPSERPAER